MGGSETASRRGSPRRVVPPWRSGRGCGRLSWWAACPCPPAMPLLGSAHMVHPAVTGLFSELFTHPRGRSLSNVICDASEACLFGFRNSVFESRVLVFDETGFMDAGVSISSRLPSSLGSVRSQLLGSRLACSESALASQRSRPVRGVGSLGPGPPLGMCAARGSAFPRAALRPPAGLTGRVRLCPRSRRGLHVQLVWGGGH